jgi:hypothetical protein
VLSKNEPTDRALESIASILDGPGSHSEPTDLALATISSILDHSGPENAVAKAKPPEEVEIAIPSQNDPTNVTLTNIAGILDVPGSHPEPEKAVAEAKPSEEVEIAIPSQNDPTNVTLATIAGILNVAGSHPEPERALVEEKPDPSAQVEADGYSKVGPGLMLDIRFKWTVRCEGDGAFFVDETIGKFSLPMSSGPMSADAAIRFVDDQQRKVCRRFDALKSEMTRRAA